MGHNPQGQRMPREQRHAQVVALRRSGLTFNEIAAQLGLARSTVTSAYYDPSGTAEYVRRHKADGECVECGVPTHSGGAVPPKRCQECSNLDLGTRKLKSAAQAGRVQWTDDEILDALRSVAVDGNLPIGAYYAAGRERRLPSVPIIFVRFGSWVAAKHAAGLTGTPSGANHHRWTAERCREAVLALTDELDDVPTYTAYVAWREDHPEYPCGSIVRRMLGGWSGVLGICERHLARDARRAA